MCASWLAVFRPHGYRVTRMDAGRLDVLANDPASHHMLGNDMCDALSIHPIIQSGYSPRTGERGKPGAEHRRRLTREDFTHQHVGPLCTAPETALPHQLGVLLRTMRLQRGLKHIVEHGR